MQVFSTWCDIPEIVMEKQKINIRTHPGNNFTLTFLGNRTIQITVGLSTLVDLQRALQSIPTISSVSVTSDRSSIITKGGNIFVEFLDDLGSLPLLESSGPDLVFLVQRGFSPYKIERQVIRCRGEGGTSS